MPAGDFVRWARQVLDLLGQLAEAGGASTTLRATARAGDGRRSTGACWPTTPSPDRQPGIAVELAHPVTAMRRILPCPDAVDPVLKRRDRRRGRPWRARSTISRTGWSRPTLCYALSVLGSLLGLICTVRVREAHDARPARLVAAAGRLGHRRHRHLGRCTSWPCSASRVVGAQHPVRRRRSPWRAAIIADRGRRHRAVHRRRSAGRAPFKIIARRHLHRRSASPPCTTPAWRPCGLHGDGRLRPDLVARVGRDRRGRGDRRALVHGDRQRRAWRSSARRWSWASPSTACTSPAWPRCRCTCTRAAVASAGARAANLLVPIVLAVILRPGRTDLRGARRARPTRTGAARRTSPRGSPTGRPYPHRPRSPLRSAESGGPPAFVSRDNFRP